MPQLKRICWKKRLGLATCTLIWSFIGHCEATGKGKHHDHHHKVHQPLDVHGDTNLALDDDAIAYENVEKDDLRKRDNVYFSSTYPANAAQATVINTPTPISTVVLGDTVRSPATQYLPVATQALPSLGSSLTAPTLNTALTENYPMWNGSGTLSLTSGNQALLIPMVTTPSYSRDQGKGGTVNGYHLFLFADTQDYTNPNATTNGVYTGSSSNSVAVDVGLRAASGSSPALRDMLGSMKGPKGQLRGFIPYTTGEAAFNAQAGAGARYAIWPESSLIALDPLTSLLFAPIIFQNVTGGAIAYNQAGVTLCEITVPSLGGPVANRVVPRLFTANDPQFGALGGTRSFGSSGYDGGYVYVFGKVKTGLLLGKAAANQVTNPNAYQWFYPGVGWNSTRPDRNSISCFTNGTFSAVDVFYSPRHLTFIMIFMDNYADNRIQWKYLLSPPILPTYAGGKASDIAQNIALYKWSNPVILYQIPTPPQSYSYGGGVHLGYFGANDISRGGTQMLLSWTWPNGQDAASVKTGYSIQTAVITWT